MAKIIIPTPLRKFTDGNSNFLAEADNVKTAVNELISTYPGIKQHLLDDAGNIRQFIKIFVGDEDIRDLQGEQTAVANATVISIVPAIAGGC